jgi:hypothetical protein
MVWMRRVSSPRSRIYVQDSVSVSKLHFLILLYMVVAVGMEGSRCSEIRIMSICIRFLQV